MINTNISINIKKMIIPVTIILLLFAVTFLSFKLYFYREEIVKLQKTEQAKQVNVKVLSFTKLFIEKVINSREEVSFDDRLKLENSIRDINDQELLNKWKKFTESKNQEDVQKAVVELINGLIERITVQ